MIKMNFYVMPFVIVIVSAIIVGIVKSDSDL